MIKIEKTANCCGCTACASICNHNAITMQPDALGFLYPVVDENKCTDCGLCENVCAFNNNYDRSQNLPQPIAYAARHKDMYEVETSRSGAAFIAISDWILEQGGVVYGAGYTDHFRVVHKRAVTKEERKEFKGSKYVQSDLNTVFRSIKQDLKQGLIVLFSGTPCQTSGLASYIGKYLRDNLYLIDIVCHGVPSPYIWRDYLTYLEDKQGDEICSVSFRDKQMFGWKAHKEKFEFSGSQSKISSSFTYLFSKNIMLRHSCGVCHFTSIKRPSDITIADFWGYEKTDANFNSDDKGCSLVLLNTDKGHRLFEIVKKDMNVIPAKLENCMQPNLLHPSTIHKYRDAFERDYTHKGLVYVMKKYGDMGWRYKFKILFNKTKKISKLWK